MKTIFYLFINFIYSRVDWFIGEIHFLLNFLLQSAGAGTEPYLLCSVVSFFGLKVRKLFLLYFDYLNDSNSILVTIVFKNMQYAVAIVCDLEPVA